MIQIHPGHLSLTLCALFIVTTGNGATASRKSREHHPPKKEQRNQALTSTFNLPDNEHFRESRANNKACSGEDCREFTERPNMNKARYDKSLANAERRFERKRNKIQRRLSKLRRQNLDDLNSFSSSKNERSHTAGGLPVILGINVRVFKGSAKNEKKNPYSLSNQAYSYWKKTLKKVGTNLSGKQIRQDNENMLNGNNHKLSETKERSSTEGMIPEKDSFAHNILLEDPESIDSHNVTEVKGRTKSESKRHHKRRLHRKKVSRRKIEGKLKQEIKISSDRASQRDYPRYLDRSGDLASRNRDWRRRNQRGRPSLTRDGRISTEFNRSYRELMLHLHGSLNKLYQWMDLINKGYGYTINGTRYDIMMGARDFFKELSEANVYIYEGVTDVVDWTRNVYMEAHKAKALGPTAIKRKHRKSHNVKERNFRPMMMAGQEELFQIRLAERELELMKTKCMNQNYRVQRIKKSLEENYDYQVLRDLYDSLRDTIIGLNRGNVKSHRMRKLKRQSTHIFYVREFVQNSSDVLQNSSMLLRPLYGLYRENHHLFIKWQREHWRTSDPRFQKDMPPVSQYDFRTLQILVEKAKMNKQYIEHQLTGINRGLKNSVENAKMAIKDQTKNGGWIQVVLEMSKLKKIMQDSYVWLNKLSNHIGSDVKLSYITRCQSWPSVFPSDDEDLDLCPGEGSGEGSGDVSTGTDDEDFTFEGVSEKTANLKESSLKDFGKDLRVFAATTLSVSEQLNVDIGKLENRKKKLRKAWSRHSKSDHGQVSVLHQEVLQQKDDLITQKQMARTRITVIASKLDRFDKYDLKEIKNMAARALERSEAMSLEKKDPTKYPKTTSTTSATSSTMRKIPTAQEVDIKETTTDPVTTDETDKETGPDDDFDYSQLFKNAKEYRSNVQDLIYLRSKSSEACARIGGHFNNIQHNISSLRDKIDHARKLLSSLQMSVRTSGESFISVDVEEDRTAAPVPSLVTSFSMGLKPTTLDGTVLTVKGNNSASYSLILDSGTLTLTAFDASDDDLDDMSLSAELETDKWYFVNFQRLGTLINISLTSENGQTETKAMEVSYLPMLQPLPIQAFVGGLPTDSDMNSYGNWQGCLGQAFVNGHSLALVKPFADGSNVSLCTDHMNTMFNLSYVFDGNGFVHFLRPPSERIDEISFRFRTWQNTASLLSVTTKNLRFYLTVTLVNGQLRIENSGPRQSVVLTSSGDSLNDGKYHVLKIRLQGGRLNPELDGHEETFERSRERPQKLRSIVDGVLIGAFISNDRNFIATSTGPLLGCIGDVKINQDKLYVIDAFEVHNAYEGNCRTTSIPHTCWNFGANSQAVSLGSFDKSNTLTFIVSKVAKGPALTYTRVDEENPGEVLVEMSPEGLNIHWGDTTESLERSDGEESSLFSVITIKDTGTEMVVEAWNEETSITYFDAWFSKADLSLPHKISVAAPREGLEESFTGEITHIVTGHRLLDLSPYSSDHHLTLCDQPLDHLGPPVQVTKPITTFSCD